MFALLRVEVGSSGKANRVVEAVAHDAVDLDPVVVVGECERVGGRSEQSGNGDRRDHVVGEVAAVLLEAREVADATADGEVHRVRGADQVVEEQRRRLDLEAAFRRGQLGVERDGVVEAARRPTGAPLRRGYRG